MSCSLKSTGLGELFPPTRLADRGRWGASAQAAAYAASSLPGQRSARIHASVNKACARPAAHPRLASNHSQLCGSGDLSTQLLAPRHPPPLAAPAAATHSHPLPPPPQLGEEGLCVGGRRRGRKRRRKGLLASRWTAVLPLGAALMLLGFLLSIPSALFLLPLVLQLLLPCFFLLAVLSFVSSIFSFHSFPYFFTAHTPQTPCTFISCYCQAS